MINMAANSEPFVRKSRSLLGEIFFFYFYTCPRSWKRNVKNNQVGQKLKQDTDSQSKGTFEGDPCV